MVPITKWHHENSMGLEWKQEYGTNSYQLLLNRLAEEEAAVKFYTLCVEYTRKTNDSTTLRLFKKIKEEEERHVLDLRDLAREVNPTTE
jgi:bacterioferritin (cytochrome b1)